MKFENSHFGSIFCQFCSKTSKQIFPEKLSEPILRIDAAATSCKKSEKFYTFVLKTRKCSFWSSFFPHKFDKFVF